MNADHTAEVASGERFEFGKNWAEFLKSLDEARIAAAETSLKEMLECEDLRGRSFVDVGCGSGLFSLAARRLGAHVRSFDYDPHSVACTRELRRHFYPHDTAWLVEEGSALDRAYLESLGQFDVVYSWGVLHHTGAMWPALEKVAGLVAPDGKLFIAIYNDQGWASRTWTWVKQTYNWLPAPLKPLVLWPAAIRLWGPTMVRDTLRARPGHTWRNYGAGSNGRGMHPWRDVVDWVGGYPFEVATPAEIISFYRKRGMTLLHLKGRSGKGCNEFVFQAG